MPKFILISLSLIILISFSFRKPPVKVVFLGDSITQAGAKPNGYISLLNKMLDSLGRKDQYSLIGAGISGNKVPDLQKRLEKDVLSVNPDIVVIYIGINDVWHFYHECCKNNGGGTPPDQFEVGLKDIIRKIKIKGSKVILCTPTLIGEKVNNANALDKELDKYAEISKSVAQSAEVQLVDLRSIFKDYIKLHNSENKDSGIITSDGVHLNDEGNKFLAEEMYKALGQ